MDSQPPPPPPPAPKSTEERPAAGGGPRWRLAGVAILAAVAAAVLIVRDTGGPPVAGTATTSGATPLAGGPKQRTYDTEDGLAPLPKARPKLVEPVAGETGADTAAAPPRASTPSAEKTPKITAPASSSKRPAVATGDGVSNLKATTATALPNGVALPPLEAPQAVKDVIQAGNIIARSPYKWGGGHGNFQDNGYDCSGSVTYALYYAGLIARSATSGELMSYGKPGPGKWISIYTNPGHVYMMVAGIRFDTVARKLTGSRWQNTPVSAPGRYEVRHPQGL